MSEREKSDDNFDNFLEIVKNDKTLPKNIGEITRSELKCLIASISETNLLLRYFKVTDNDSIKALEIIKSNLALRQKGPQIFSDRDVLSDQIQNISKIV